MFWNVEDNLKHDNNLQIEYWLLEKRLIQQRVLCAKLVLMRMREIILTVVVDYCILPPTFRWITSLLQKTRQSKQRFSETAQMDTFSRVLIPQVQTSILFQLQPCILSSLKHPFHYLLSSVPVSASLCSGLKTAMLYLSHNNKFRVAFHFWPLFISRWRFN